MKIGPANLFRDEKWGTIILIVLLAALAYLPLIGQLGYYRDDWHVVWSGLVRGASSIIDLHVVDRPFMGVVYSLVFRVLGGVRIGWQLYAFGLRLLGSLAFLWLVRTLWPQKKLETTGMAVLFTVYPGFLQLPEANAYQVHLIAVLAGILSLAATVKGLAAKGTARILWLVLSSGLALFCYMVMEWMVGLEAVRPLLIYWKLAGPEPMQLANRLRKTIVAWLPNGIVFVVFMVWRVFIFKSARPVTDLSAIRQLYTSQPATMLVRLLVETGKDFFEAIFAAYVVPLYNLTARAVPQDFLIGSLIALAAAAAFLFFWRANQTRTEDPDLPWAKTAMGLGGFIVLVTLVPVILTNRDVQFQDTFDRYTLLAMIGAVMFWMGLVTAVFRPGFRSVVLTGLVFISVLTHFSNSVFFRNFWEVQRQVWWQLSWRAPDIRNGTALVVDLPSPYRLAEGYEAWGPVNLIYRPGVQTVSIASETLNDETTIRMLRQETYGRTFRRLDYTVDFKNVLLVSKPNSGACLHVLDGKRGELSEYEDSTARLLAPLSREDLIIPQGPPPALPAAVFGREPARGWCYSYQKAGLARQNGDWPEVVRLGDEARQNGFTPQDDSEWMPFYEGYAHEGRMDEANELGGILRSNEDFISMYCLQAAQTPVPEQGVEIFIVTNVCGDS